MRIVEYSTPFGGERRMYAVKVGETMIITTVTSSCSVVRQWIQTTLYRHSHYYSQNRLVVGMGVQWYPVGRDAPAATLQLCVGTRCLVVQLLYMEAVPAILRRFLESESCTFAGIWNHSDQRKLMLSGHQLRVERLLDLRYYLDDDMAGESVETIARESLGLEGVRLESEISRSNWEAEDLSEQQVMQACADAFVSFQIARQEQVWQVPDFELRY